MKDLKKYLTKILILCMAFCLLTLTACSGGKETGPQYYIYESVEIEMDIEVPDNSIYKELAEATENSINGGLVAVAKGLNVTYKDNIVKLTNEKMVWYTNNGKTEYTFSKTSGDKKQVSEVDEKTINSLAEIIGQQGANIKEGLKFYVETDGNYIELCVEVYAMQTIVEGVEMSVEYDFEYKFKKTDKRPEGESEENALANYNYENTQFEVELDVKNLDQIDLPENFINDTKTSIKEVMQSVVDGYNVALANAKISIFANSIELHNAGIKTVYKLENVDGKELISNIEDGIIKQIQDVVEVSNVMGSQITLKNVKAYFVKNENNCQLMIEFEAEKTVASESGDVKMEIEYDYTINFTK